jgi:hypothetical protein
MMVAQVGLYPGTRSKVSGPARRLLLSQLQERIGRGNLVPGSSFDRLVADDLQVAISPLGCCEVYADAGTIAALLPHIIEQSQSRGLRYHWLFLHTAERSPEAGNAGERLLQELKHQSGLESMVFGGVD